MRQRVAVRITGHDLPSSGQRWSAYKTACRELALGRTQAQRHIDRQELKAGGTLSIKGYTIQRCA